MRKWSGLYISFYSSVILNGTETSIFKTRDARGFYSSVILNGTETQYRSVIARWQFYSSVSYNNHDKLFGIMKIWQAS